MKNNEQMSKTERGTASCAIALTIAVCWSTMAGPWHTLAYCIIIGIVLHFAVYSLDFGIEYLEDKFYYRVK